MSALPDRFARELSAATSSSALPVGYALTTWCSGALLIHHHGNARVGDVFLFLAGAIAGFLVVSVLATLTADRPARPAPAQRRLAGAVHIVAVGGAVGAAALVALIGGWVAWPLTSFTATVLYLLLAALELLALGRALG